MSALEPKRKIFMATSPAPEKQVRTSARQAISVDVGAMSPKRTFRKFLIVQNILHRSPKVNRMRHTYCPRAKVWWHLVSHCLIQLRGFSRCNFLACFSIVRCAFLHCGSHVMVFDRFVSAMLNSMTIAVAVRDACCQTAFLPSDARRVWSSHSPQYVNTADEPIRTTGKGEQQHVVLSPSPAPASPHDAAQPKGSHSVSPSPRGDRSNSVHSVGSNSSNGGAAVDITSFPMSQQKSARALECNPAAAALVGMSIGAQ